MAEAPARPATFAAPAAPPSAVLRAHDRAASTSEALAATAGAPTGSGESKGFGRGGGSGAGGDGDGAASDGDGAASERRGAGGGSRAHLLGAGNPCGDLFPYAASSDSGTVAVALDVATSGQPLEPRIVEETPRGQGFALAARHCVRRLRFAPAFDGSGHPVASRSLVRLRFDRSSERTRAAL